MDAIARSSTHDVHGHFVRHNPEPALQFDPLDIPPYPLDQALNHLPHFLSADRPCTPHSTFFDFTWRTRRERHLQVDLRKLGLTVFAPVFVAKAPGQLEILVDRARGDQELFGLLWGLLQRVELGWGR